MPADVPLLYHFRLSHYAEKARWALDWKRWPHRRAALVPGFHAARTFWLTRQIGLPVLVLEGRPVVDSTRIIAEVERRRPDPPLYPADPALRERALAIEERFDEEVAPDLRRLFWATFVDDPARCAALMTDGFGRLARGAFRAAYPAMRRVFRSDMGLSREEVAAARARLPGHFERLEREIGPSGYLAGEAFSVADLTAASVMAAILRPGRFSYPMPEPWPGALVEMRASVADRPGARWVEEIYARHRGASAEVPPP